MAIGEILSGAGSLFGSIGNAIWGQQQSKDLMRYQAKLNQQAVDAQNQYNSPIEQMNRLRQAGLNPNLVYGNGVDGNQSNAATVSQANRNPQLDSGLIQAVETFFKRQQLKNETRNSTANEQLALANTALAKSKNIRAMQDIALTDKTFDFQVDKAKADLDYTLQAMKESAKRVDKLDSDISLNASRANEIQENIRLIEAKTATEKLQPQVLKARIEQLLSSADLNREQAAVARSVVALNDKKVEQLVSVIRGLDLDNGLKAIEYQMTESLNKLGVKGFTKKDLVDLIKIIVKGLVN